MAEMDDEQRKALMEKLKQMSPEELREFQKKQCIFCQIVAGKMEGKKVYEDETSFAILDINPANLGHVLLMPKEHYAIMPQIPEEEISHLGIVSKQLSLAVLKALKAEGTTIFIANGLAAGQKAQHFMVHIIPRNENDGVGLVVPQRQVSEEDLKKFREVIQNKVNEIFGIKKEIVVEKPKEKEEVKEEEAVEEKKEEWYEKFHWFYTSEDFLCIGGRDATSNEIVVKKHTDKNDLILHTDMSGSPFFVIKKGQEATEKSIRETAQATASYSKAWKRGLTTLDVFYVKPEQVSKKSKAGEYMAKGAFMVYGETKYIHPNLEIAIGVTHEKRVIGGPTEAIKARAEKYVILVPGRKKTSDTAKSIKKKLEIVDLDEITAFIPAGGCSIR